MSVPEAQTPPGLTRARLYQVPAPDHIHQPGRLRRSLPTDEQSLSLVIEVKMLGDRRYADAIELIDGIQRLAQGIGNGAPSQARPAASRAAAGPAESAPTGATGATGASLPLDHGGGQIEIFPDARVVRHAGAEIGLTRIEFDLLLFLAEHPRRAFTRPQLLNLVWGYGHTGERTVDVHIRRLRAALSEAPLVTTVRGVGYRLADDSRIRVIRPAAATRTPATRTRITVDQNHS